MLVVRTRKTRSEDIFKLLLFFTRVRTRRTDGPFRNLPRAGVLVHVSAIVPDFVRVNGHADAPVIFFPQHGDRALRTFRAGIMRRHDLGDGAEHRVGRGVLRELERCVEAAHGGGLGVEHVGRLLVAEERDERAVEGEVGEGRARVQRGAGERGGGRERAGEVVRLRHHDGVFREQVRPGGWRVEGLELPCERLDRVDQLGHSEFY